MKPPKVTIGLSDVMRVGSVQLAKVGVPSEEIQVFYAEATSGDHDHLLRTCMRWFATR